MRKLPVVMFVIALGLFLGAGAFAAEMYVVDSMNRLGEVDPATGARTWLGGLIPTNGPFSAVVSLSFAPDGQLYAYSDAQTLAIIDPATLEVTRLADDFPALGIDYARGISFAADGSLYLLDDTNDLITHYDLDVHAILDQYATSTMDLQTGITVDDINGMLYFCEYHGGLYQYDLSSSVESFLGDLTSPILDLCLIDDADHHPTICASTAYWQLQYVTLNPWSVDLLPQLGSDYIQGLAYWPDQQEIPEPTCLVLAITGVLAAGMVRLRRGCPAQKKP